MKLFISYSREDAGDFAKHIHKYLRNNSHDVFIDINSIRIGDPWAGSIEKNISDCEIFVVILTPDSLKSTHVDREVLQAQRENKIIVPCISEDVDYSEIKWGLEKVQGIEFTDEYKLARRLYSRIKSYNTSISSDKDTPDISGLVSLNDDDAKNTITPTQDNIDKISQEKDMLQPPKDRTETSPSKIIDRIDTAATQPKTPDADTFEQQKDSPQPLKVKIDKTKPSKPSEKKITISSSRKEEEEKKSASKNMEDVKSGAMTSTKSNIDKVDQKKEDLQPISNVRMGALGSGVPSIPSKITEDKKINTKSYVGKLEQKKGTSQPPSNVNIGAIGGVGGVPPPQKYTTTSESDNNERNYTKRNSDTSQSQGINLKLIIIPIIAVAIIGLIVGISYFNQSSPGTELVTTSPPPLQPEITPTEDTESEFFAQNQTSPPLQPEVTPTEDTELEFFAQNQTSPPLQPEVTPTEDTELEFFAQNQTSPPVLEPEVTPTNNIIQRYHFISSWGSEGTGDGQFSYAEDIAVDSAGYVYVLDSGNNRIQKFDSNGNFITNFVRGYEYTKDSRDFGRGMGKILIADDGELVNPSSLALDTSGNVYVIDGGNWPSIQKFDSNGNFIIKWASSGSGDRGISSGSHIAVDTSGNVYVADQLNNRIQKFDSNGNFITMWGSEGTGDGQFSRYAEGIAVDSAGYVYVVDTYNYRIQKFDSNGNFITMWGSEGTGDGQFSYAEGIAVDSADSVYVVDSGNNDIQKFDSNGNFITKWGSYGEGMGEFHRPSSISFDSSGNAYIVDTANNRIQVFAPTT